jgi:hypothetical protein
MDMDLLQLRYRAKVTGGNNVEKWAYDIFFVLDAPTACRVPTVLPPKASGL